MATSWPSASRSLALVTSDKCAGDGLVARAAPYGSRDGLPDDAHVSSASCHGSPKVNGCAVSLRVGRGRRSGDCRAPTGVAGLPLGRWDATTWRSIMSESATTQSAPAGLTSTERYYGPGDANGRYLVLVVDEIVGEEEAYRTSDLAVAAAEFDRCQAQHPMSRRCRSTTPSSRDPEALATRPGPDPADGLGSLSPTDPRGLRPPFCARSVGVAPTAA